MTAHAFARQLVLEVPAAMAGLAGCLLVDAQQCKAGFLLMIELGIGPRTLRVAGGAVGAAWQEVQGICA